MRVQDEAIFRNFKIFNLVVLFGIENMFAVSCKPLAQMHIVTVAAKAGAIVWRNFIVPFQFPPKSVCLKESLLLLLKMCFV